MGNDESKLVELFDYILTNGKEEKTKKWNNKAPLMNVVNKQIPMVLMNIIIKLGKSFDCYTISGKSGACGSWCNNMYICIFEHDPSENNTRFSASNGVYVAYLFSQNCDKIYLSYMLGAGSTYEIRLKRYKEQILSQIDANNYETNTCTMDLINRPRHYKDAVILFKEYNKENLNKSSLSYDLNNFLEIQHSIDKVFLKNLKKLGK